MEEELNLVISVYREVSLPLAVLQAQVLVARHPVARHRLAARHLHQVLVRHQNAITVVPDKADLHVLEDRL